MYEDKISKVKNIQNCNPAHAMHIPTDSQKFFTGNLFLFSIITVKEVIPHAHFQLKSLLFPSKLICPPVAQCLVIILRVLIIHNPQGNLATKMSDCRFSIYLYPHIVSRIVGTVIHLNMPKHHANSPHFSSEK